MNFITILRRTTTKTILQACGGFLSTPLMMDNNWSTANIFYRRHASSNTSSNLALTLDPPSSATHIIMVGLATTTTGTLY